MTSLKTNCISSEAPRSSYIPMPIAMHSCRMECCCTIRASSILSLLSILNSIAPERSVPRQTGMMRYTSQRIAWKKHYGITITNRYTRKFITLVLRILFYFFLIKHRIQFNKEAREGDPYCFLMFLILILIELERKVRSSICVYMFLKILINILFDRAKFYL